MTTFCLDFDGNLVSFGTEKQRADFIHECYDYCLDEEAPVKSYIR